MKYSVVIPTYNEEKYLGQCLASILKGSILPDEIIVADGLSSDKTVEIASHYGARIVVNQRRHAAGGRNTGIKTAKGDVIVFIDADCTADKDWMKEIKTAFEQEDIDGLGTYIRPAVPANIYEEFWGRLSLQILMTYGEEAYYVHNKSLNEAFITASCAYKRKLLYHLKGFSNYFGNNAEDIDLCWRALDAGAKLKYVPSAKITAHSPQDLGGIRKKSFRNGVSSSKLQKVYSDSLVNFDPNLYHALAANVKGMFRNEQYASLFVFEILCHLAGKYSGSIKYHVINI